MVYSNFLSPIDDYSDLAFRLLCQKYGAVAGCVPLVNSTAIARDRSKVHMVDAHIDEQNIGVQVVGNEPTDISKSCQAIVEEKPFVKWLNINCGCPSVRTMNSGGGSAMLAFPDKIASSVSLIKKFSPVPISVKIRIKNNSKDTISICKALETAGVDFLILHGRTAGAGYSGRADWNLIKEVKEAIIVPLVGNGDIQSVEQGNEYVKNGFCDSFMIARSAMSNPAVFSRNGSKASSKERLSMFCEYFSIYEKYFSAKPQLREAKLKAVNFVNGIPNAASIRKSLCLAKSTEELVSIVDQCREIV